MIELVQKRITLERAIIIANLYGISLETLIEKDLAGESVTAFKKQGG